MNILFDLAIFFFLLAVGVFLLETKANWKKMKRPRLMKAVAVVLGIGWAVVFYGSFIEPQMLVVTEQSVELGESDVELHAVVVADFHVGPYKGDRWIKRVVEKVQAQEPDIILIPGDFIYSMKDDLAKLRDLSKLDAPEGVYAVTGNHDYTDDADRPLIALLETFGIIVLQNETEQKTFSDQAYLLAGVSDLWNDGDMYETTKSVESEDTTILLSHNPDAVIMSNVEDVDLIISGHTHGGQIRLPWYGSVPRIPTLLGNDYDRGLFTFGDQQVFLTSGVGESGPRARLFTPPEIVNLMIRL